MSEFDLGHAMDNSTARSATGIVGATLDSYSPEDQTFFKFWYGHMLDDLMQPPLCSIDHATARYIWNAALARATPQHPDPIGYVSKQTLEMLRGPDLAPNEHVRLWHAENPPSRATIPVYLSATPQHSVTEQAVDLMEGVEQYSRAFDKACGKFYCEHGRLPAPIEIFAIAQPLASTAATQPDDIRAAGWTVAVHNDYRLNGEAHTFWLFTKGDRAVKGEGKSDAEALAQVRAALAIPASTAPAQQACTVPPPGWYCTRTLGHSGPCAAYPVQQGNQDEEKHAGANDQVAAPDTTDDTGRIGASGRAGADQHNQHRVWQSGANGRDGAQDSGSAGLPDSGEVRKIVAPPKAKKPPKEKIHPVEKFAANRWRNV